MFFGGKCAEGGCETLKGKQSGMERLSQAGKEVGS